MPTTRYAIYFWKQIPLFRLLVPLIAGVLIQWYAQPSLSHLLTIASVSIVMLAAFYVLPEAVKYRLRWLQGISLQVLVVIGGAFITWHHDIRHNSLWVGNHYRDSTFVVATLDEPLVEKEKSYKAIASLNAVKAGRHWQEVKGSIIIYFRKDSVMPPLHYGSQILFNKPLQKITNSGNPGAFDYQRYCAFQDIYHQCFLRANEYAVTNNNNGTAFRQWLFGLRNAVVSILKDFIYDEQEEGVAEALLIGYRDDLDKNLVQAYSNTGVVHIIAISGLHLGMIYAVLVLLFKRFRKKKWITWVKPLVILCILWIFSLLAGAAPSILRSAVMFTCIILGEMISRKSSVYNTLAVSAFAMLCYNPYFLWDVGFQLSYAAVLSIVAFMKPIYNWFYIKNKLLDTIWRLNAVTLSAQVLTLPFVLFHFHQFPNYFLITNFVVVPLSSIILFAELGLIIASKFTIIADWIGTACSVLLRFMNGFIRQMDNLPFSITGNIQLNVPEAVILLIGIVAAAYWLLRNHKWAFYSALCAFVLLVALNSFSFITQTKQKKLVVYNVPQHTGIDLINGTHFYFTGDSALCSDDFLRNFHLKAARIQFGVSDAKAPENLTIAVPFVLFNGKRILIYDKRFHFRAKRKVAVDVIVLSKNQRVRIAELAGVFDCRQFVFDASNTPWKIRQWKKDCDSLHLPHHSTPEQGAFIMDL